VIETITGVVVVGGVEYPVSEQVQLPDQPSFLARIFRRHPEEEEDG
jgi:hypothetical protein